LRSVPIRCCSANFQPTLDSGDESPMIATSCNLCAKATTCATLALHK
jgi:hypothetical protein